MTPTNDRWRTAVHEAGHAVACVELGGRCSGLALFPTGGGLAGTQGLFGDKHAFMTASGHAAEILATEYSAPELPVVETAAPEPSIDTIGEPSWFSFNTARYEEQPERYETDQRTLALWSIAGREEDPDSWARRVRFAHHVADQIVKANATRIVRLAAELFVKNRLSRVEIETLI